LIHQPTPGRVTKIQENKALGITTLTLSNGAKVILKPTSFSNNEIMLQGISEGGTSRYPDSDFQSAKIADNIVPNGGVGNYNLTELTKFLQDKHVGVDPFIIERFQGINAQMTSDQVETAMQLVYAYFTEPRKDTAGFISMMQRAKASLANRANNPNQVFHDTLWAATSNYNIRRTGPTMAKYDQVNFDRAFSIYKERFADASGFTFILAGNFRIDKIRPLLEKYLASLPSTYRHEKAADLDIHPVEGKVTKIIRMGNEPKATVEIFFSGKFDYSFEDKIKLDATKEALQIRLLQRLREEESGVYAPSVFEITNKYPVARYSLFIRFGCSPQNVDKLIASTLDEVNKLRTAGPSAENVDKWRAERKTSQEPQLRQNGFWLSYFSNQIQNNEDFFQITKESSVIDHISPGDIKEIANKYLTGDNLVKIELLPDSVPH